MKKIFILLLVLITAVCSAYAEEGLFVQGGRGAQLNNEYYMVVGEGETHALVRISQGGEPMIALRAEEIGGMVVSDGALYYLMQNEGCWELMAYAGGRTKSVYRFDEGVTVSDIGARDGLLFMLADGRLHILYPEHSMCIQLSGVVMEDYVIHDDYAYYISGDNRVEYELADTSGRVACAERGMLCRVNMSTGRYEKLLKEGADSLQYADGKLYFHYFEDRYLTGSGDYMTVNGRLYTYDIAAGEAEKLTEMYDWEFFAGDDGIYVLRSGAVVKLAGATETILCAVPQVVEIVSAGDSFVVFDAHSMTFGLFAK